MLTQHRRFPVKTTRLRDVGSVFQLCCDAVFRKIQPTVKRFIRPRKDEIVFQPVEEDFYPFHRECLPPPDENSALIYRRSRFLLK